MATIFIDGKAYEADPDQNLLHVCLQLGFNLPYFCWHPELGSVGACRQCAVKQFKDEKDTKGKIVMACMTPASDGTRISIDDAEARSFRSSVGEWLMLNHPHDCPICDEGGECHLQDMTVMTGHDYRRFEGDKRTFRNQDLGPFINHEMNRCIQCYRCVRFYKEFAGGRDFGAFQLRNQVYFGRQSDGVLENEFSGNLVEVCPTGVFTDKSLKRHYTRKWDLQTAPSICVHCSIGCNTIPGERYGSLRRIRNRYHGDINRYFLCDRGRYGYEFVNSDRRLRRPLLRRTAGASPEQVSGDDAVRLVARILKENRGVVGIGSPRASLEANFALRTLVGAENFHAGMSDREEELVTLALEILRGVPARPASLHEAMQSDAVLILGEDVTNTAPMLALALRQSVRQQPMEDTKKQKIPSWQDAAVREAIQQAKGPLFLAAPAATRLDDVARRTLRASPGDIARLGFAVAGILDRSSPEVPGLSKEMSNLAEQIAGELSRARRPLIVSGCALESRPVLEAAANVARALSGHHPDARLLLVAPECNTFGVGLMEGRPLSKAFAAVSQGQADTLFVLENDLFRRAEAGQVEALLTRARHVVVIDSLTHETMGHAGIALPGATFAESTGTFVNYEGRAQRAFCVYPAQDEVRESWRWLRDIMESAGRKGDAAWENLEEVTAALSRALPLFEKTTKIAPPPEFRIAGMKVPRQPHRYSGRTAMTANIDVNEPRPPTDRDAPMTFTMEGYPGQPPPALIHEFWSPGWNSVQSLNKFQSEIGGPLRGGDPGRHLIETEVGKDQRWFQTVPGAFQPRKDEWLVVPLHHIFGSEELSVLSPGIAGLAPRPYLALNPDDAASLPADEGAEAEIVTGGCSWRLPVRLLSSLPRGVAGIGSGLPGMRGAVTFGWGRIRKSPEGADEDTR